jgi:hypothetical protein
MLNEVVGTRRLVKCKPVFEASNAWKHGLFFDVFLQDDTKKKQGNPTSVINHQYLLL